MSWRSLCVVSKKKTKKEITLLAVVLPALSTLWTFIRTNSPREVQNNTHRKVLSFLFRLSFLIVFLCIFLFAAASGFVVACRTRATLRSLRTPKTPCRIWVYTAENLVVPTLFWISSWSSVAVVLSSSVGTVQNTINNRHMEAYQSARHGWCRPQLSDTQVLICEQGTFQVSPPPCARPLQQTIVGQQEAVETMMAEKNES